MELIKPDTAYAPGPNDVNNPPKENPIVEVIDIIEIAMPTSKAINIMKESSKITIKYIEKTASQKIEKQIIVKGFEKLKEHFIKHGKEFGAKDAKEYFAKAKEFLKSKGEDIITWVRKRDGAIIKANKKDGNMIIVHPDGNIGTFHKNYDFLKDPQKFINKN